jgi:hypothetical protein
LSVKKSSTHLAKIFSIKNRLFGFMEVGWKRGAFVGVVSAGFAYFLALEMGFNSSSFTFLLYLYVVTGLTAGLDLEGLNSGVLDRVYIATREEEVKLKKIFSNEVYRVKGTIERDQ